MGHNISEARFSHDLLRDHLFKCHERQRLSQFPEPKVKERSTVTGKEVRVQIRVPELLHKLLFASFEPAKKKKRK